MNTVEENEINYKKNWENYLMTNYSWSPNNEFFIFKNWIRKQLSELHHKIDVLEHYYINSGNFKVGGSCDNYGNETKMSLSEEERLNIKEVAKKMADDINNVVNDLGKK